MEKIIIIVNPHARQNKRDPKRAGRMAGIVAGCGEVYETMRREELRSLCRSLASGKAGLVGVCGGDGTIHIVLTEIVSAYRASRSALPKILFLRGGSMNTICRNLGVRENAEQTAKAIAQRILSCTPIATFSQGMLDVNGRQGFLYGNGYGYNMLKEYYSATELPPGPARATKVVLNAIGSSAIGGAMAKRLGNRFKARVDVDGNRAPFDEFGMMLAGTLSEIGVGFRPIYRARERLGHFHFVGTGLSPFGVFTQLNRFYAGRRMTGPHHIDTLATRVRIDGDEEIGYTLDGEIYSEKVIDITAGPLIDVVVPNRV